jgi:hypothetical protein
MPTPPPQQNGLAARLLHETGLAKEALATLPVSDTTMNNVSKYISQVGDFSMSLSNRISGGGHITEQEYKTIEELHTYAQKLSTNLSSLKLDYSSANFSSQFKQTAEDFANFPSLIYDGPFSDHINRQGRALFRGQKRRDQRRRLRCGGKGAQPVERQACCGGRHYRQPRSL